ncbi:fructose ABC transporter fructose-binding protein [Arthrobacter globiformis NBRC 12137]|uniref:Fructose ABC transporter fructose-binding protein n=1 Tax=Arthrobacter globiformis (strain ATCC 8010 / DSM 20124 / JCM 1332 / NBRC 12137 / NCIMB 8907 / NRRL B-2979 / 168) TaxID=1077972 RepID=H0QJ26_ARTG1|nr:substrate-binding domain-containing protein [Arthrobacter globiformis]GAB12827.1 fructose ABC transporter fructose-binding protein [Arthrobacter globiformis NBRC 12137]
MLSSKAPRTVTHRLLAIGAVLTLGTLSLTACGGSSSTTSPAGTSSGEKVGVSLIVKTTSNPFFVSMQDGAKKAAETDGVDLKLAAGKADGDEETQIQAIENAISKGDKGILITPNGPSVVDALKKAKDAGLFVIALDTPPDPADAADITFATDNFAAGELIGKWTAAQLGGKKATIALLDLFDDKVVSVDYNRDQGFLTGLGIDTADKKKNGDEAKTGKYTGGKGGDYEIVGSQASQGAEDGGRTAMETLLAKNPNVNVVYTINEPAAAGAFEALKSAGKEKDVLVVSVDGGCSGVNNVKAGVIGATAQQYPVKMAELGVKAIVELAKTGKKPANSPGLDFYNTGVELVTDKAADGVKSITTSEASKICWGK